METIELIKRSRAGDKLAREQVIKANMPLVYSIVKRFAGRGYDAEDLSQIGAIGLIKAVDNFNVNFEVKFSTYAVPVISGEIKRFLRDDGMVKVSRTLKENGIRIKRAAEMLAIRLGRDATLEELSVATELAREDIVMALEAGSEVESLHKTVFQKEGSEILPPKKFIFRCLPITMPIPELSINVIPEKSNINVLTFPFSICKSTTLLICPAV